MPQINLAEIRARLRAELQKEPSAAMVSGVQSQSLPELKPLLPESPATVREILEERKKRAEELVPSPGGGDAPGGQEPEQPAQPEALGSIEERLLEARVKLAKAQEEYSRVSNIRVRLPDASPEAVEHEIARAGEALTNAFVKRDGLEQERLLEERFAKYGAAEAS